MQVFCAYSEEDDTSCMGIFDNETKLFRSSALKVPHMGWNSVTQLQSPLFEGLSDNAWVYFVHSFYVEANTIATCDYVLPFSAGMQKENFYGVQFHPEKSSTAGQVILRNFLNLCQSTPDEEYHSQHQNEHR